MVGHPPSSTEVVNLNSMQSAKATDTHQRTVFLCPGIIDNSASTNLFSNVQSRTRVSRENWWLPASGSLRGHHRLRGSSIHTDNTICHFWDKHGFVEAQPRHMTSTLWKKSNMRVMYRPMILGVRRAYPKRKAAAARKLVLPVHWVSIPVHHTPFLTLQKAGRYSVNNNGLLQPPARCR